MEEGFDIVLSDRKLKWHLRMRKRGIQQAQLGIPNIQGMNRVIGAMAYALKHRLETPSFEVIKWNGRLGIGRWMIAQGTAKIAMESHSFDVSICVKLSKNEWSPRNLQKAIAEHLGIKLAKQEDVYGNDSDEANWAVATAIQEKLKDKTFLLVAGDEGNDIDLGWVGVPRVNRRGTQVGSKVILVKDGMQSDLDFYLSDESSLVLVLGEANVVAHSLRISRDSVIGCLFYVSRTLRVRDSGAGEREVTWLTRYMMVEEGFMTTTGGGGEEIGTTIEEEEALEDRVVRPLLEELRDRSLIGEFDPILITYPYVMEILQRDENYVNNYKFWITKDSLPPMLTTDVGRWRAIAITISTDNDKDGITSLPLSPEWPYLTTLLIKCTDQVVEFDIPPPFFEHMRQCLRVLDLSFTPLTFLPSSISSLSNLRLLRLHGCQKLKAIPTSFQALEKLVYLDLSKCYSLHTIPDETFERMSNLRILDLSNSGIMSLPSSVSNLCSLQKLLCVDCKSLAKIQEKSFDECSMQHLQVLALSGASSLESLPHSLCNLVGLKKLILYNCSSLKTTGLGVGFHSLRNFSKLEELYLGYCALEDMEFVSFGDLIPNIKRIYLWFMTTPKGLSFKGCRKLMYLGLSHIECLQVLNVSGTTELMEFGFDTSLEEHPLRHLEMLPIRYDDDNQDVVPFEGLNWDDINDVGARIWLLRNEDISKYLPKKIFKAKCFSRFHIRISSFTKERPSMLMPMGDFPNILFQRNQFVYKDIYRQIQTYIFPNFKSTYHQHLEIFESDVESQSLEHLLPEAKLLTFYGNRSIDSLFLYPAERSKLKECRIGSCHGMKEIFRPIYGDVILECLEVMWVSDLPQLTTVHGSSFSYQCSMAFLKHIHLERCPKLVTVFTSDCHIESLQTLEIKFCSRLKVVFGSREVSLERLRSLSLFRLPKLESLGTVNLPKLQKMRVRGCPMLKKLPLRVRIINDHVPYDASDVAEIEGETNWWNHLRWADEDHAIEERPVRFRPARNHVLVKQRKGSCYTPFFH